jgi:hypothetical protein
MARNPEYIQDIYNKIVQEINDLKRKGISVTKSNKYPDRESAIAIVAEKYKYKYSHVYKIYYKLFKG